MSDEFKRSTIVHVEDDLDFLKIVADKLAPHKYSPIPATSSKQAMEIVHSLDGPCILFIDHNLKGDMSGQKLLGYFNKTTWPVSKWIYTADERPEIEAACRLAGADGVIDKRKSMNSQMYLLSTIYSAEIFIRDRLDAKIDPLTGMRNRKEGSEQAQRLLDIAKRDKKFVVVASGDVDNFKSFNDLYGHQMGDLVLIKVGETITNHVRQTDVAYRPSGDEFVILFHGSKLRGAQNIVRLINRTLFGEPVDMGKGFARPRITFGFCQVDPSDRKMNLIKAMTGAEDDLVKRKKRNKVGR